MTYQHILDEYGSVIPYQILLGSDEWKQKRVGIILRDKSTCLNCNKRGTDFFEFGKPFYVDEKEVSKNILLGMEKVSIIVPELAIIPQLEPVVLNVHHEYYVLTRLPWDYPNDALKTLCSICHEEFHRKNAIRVFENERMSESVKIECCDRCEGVGQIKEYYYHHNGICFKCLGTGLTNLNYFGSK